MTDWLLCVSRDAELANAISHAIFRAGGKHHLWAVECADRARALLCGKSSLPTVIVLDQFFLPGAPLKDSAEEFACFAPIIVIAGSAAQGRLAPLVAAGKVDFVFRDDRYIPLTAALVERTIRRETEVENHITRSEPCRFRPESNAAVSATSSADLISVGQGPNGQKRQALRLVGAILDHLESVSTERSRLTLPVARRLDRVADLAFELQRNLRPLPGVLEGETEPFACL